MADPSLYLAARRVIAWVEHPTTCGGGPCPRDIATDIRALAQSALGRAAVPPRSDPVVSSFGPVGQSVAEGLGAPGAASLDVVGLER
jgi:hypothetical protein